MTVASPKEIFRNAIVGGAAAIIIAHNHPSGDPTPSLADIRITQQIKDCSKILGIEFLDHIVVGEVASDPKARGHYSFREEGLI